MRSSTDPRSFAHALESRYLMTISTLSAAADTYVRDGSFAGSNFGGVSELVVKQSGTGFNREALLQFNLGAIGPNITSAKLRVFGSLQDNRQPNVPTDIFGSSTAWTESGVTWNSRPSPSTAKLASFTVANATGAWYEVDVTSFIQTQKTAGQTAVGLLLKNPVTAAPFTELRSRETSNKPTLVITHDTGGTPGASFTLMASADTYARDGSSSSSNFSSATELVVKKSGTGFNREAFIRFDTGALAGNVTGATLRVFGKLQDNRSSSVTTDVYGTTSTWAESTLTWNNRPVASTGKLGSAAFQGAAGQWYEIDVTNFVSSQRAGGASAVSLLLRNPLTSEPFSSFSSREVATNKPELIITTDGTQPPPIGQTPYGGTAATVPGRIEAERFDEGGEGIAYHDNDPANQGGAFRTDVGVDIEPASDGAGALAIGHIQAGEWLEFTTIVTKAGLYDFDIRFASGGGGGTAHLEINGAVVPGGINLSGTGGWQNWQTFRKSGVALSGGQHVIRFAFDASAGGDVGNLNWIEVSPAAPAAEPPRWPSNWQAAASAPTPRFEAAGTVVGTKIYVFGGFKSDFTVHRTHTSYNTANNTWANLGTMPVDMAESHQGIAADDRFIYIAGGFGGNLDTSRKPTQWISDKVWRYDTIGNSFSQIATLPQARGAGALDLIGRNLHYFGGNPADRVTNVGDHWVYNLDSNAWTSAAPMPDPKDHFSTVVLGGKIYAIGGEHGHDQFHQQENDLDVYDPATNAWTSLAPLPIAKSHMEAGTFALDGKIVMAGGQIDNFQPTSNVVAYDPATDSWVGMPPLPAARQGAVVRAVGNAVYFTLGGTQTNSPQSSTWVGQLPAQSAASAAQRAGGSSLPIDTPPMQTTPVTGGVIGRSSYSVLSDGAVLAQDLATGAVRQAAPAEARPFDGDDGSIAVYKRKLFVFSGTNEAKGRVQVFDTATNRWKVGKDMPSSVEGSSLTVHGRHAYLLGGTADGSPSTFAARYDLAKGKWSPLPELTVAMARGYGHVEDSAVRLSSVAGDILLILDRKAKRWTPSPPTLDVGG